MTVNLYCPATERVDLAELAESAALDALLGVPPEVAELVIELIQTLGAP